MTRVLLVCLAALIFPALASAHPGAEDSQGCHVCRKNCDAWSVPWNVKHCHAGKSEALAPFKLMSRANGDGQIPADLKRPGWEYGLPMKKISADRRLPSESAAESAK